MPDPTPSATTPTDTTAPGLPLPLDQIMCTVEHYGVKVAELGADGDEGFCAFTHDRRRAVAAVYRYLREVCDRPGKLTVSGPEWRLFVTTCGCGETCPHGDDDHECERWGLAPCRDDFAWIGQRCDEGTPGALPVIELEVSG